jgi:ADP-ribose pyrophosphatase YjhB (NUDIX family)
MGMFNEVEEKVVTAYDMQGNSHQLPLNSFKLRVSVYGILLKDDKVLVQRNPQSDTFSLPGGAIELGENVESALIREFREETGIEIRPTKVLNVKEDFWTDEGQNAFSILIIYEVARVGGQLNKDGNSSDSVEVSFISKKELLEGKIQRVFKSVVDLI